MDLHDRFFGRGTPTLGGPPVANPAIERPLSLQLLFDAPLDLDPDALTLALRTYHPELAAATAELLAVPRQGPPDGHPENDSGPGLIGLVGWGRHVVKLIGVNGPMPENVVELCVRPAHYDDELKQDAYRAAAHVLLYYAGYEDDPLERYVALAAAAGALARFGGVVVMNEDARTSVPAAVLLPHDEDEGDMLTSLRSFPIPFLYGGFVKLEVEGVPGVWMRTYGNSQLGLPDLAFHAGDHHEGTFAFNTFGNMLEYLRDSGRPFAPGHTMQVGPDTYFRLRDPAEGECYLESDGEMLVCERITAAEINTPQ
ncbi:MAG: hypothetical protein JWO38_3814 [Gemmataceae bacterium]|nr:hypothetical protein [Gemmataceae bacterium]